MNHQSASRRVWRWPAVALAGVLAAGLLTACADNSPTSGSTDLDDIGADQLAEPGKAVSDEEIAELKVGVLGQIASFDPSKEIGAVATAHSLGLESLMRIDSDGNLGPWLATGFEQTSDTVYDYTLREGVKFWDGTDLTSEDVKFSWDYLRRPETRHSTYFSSVDTIEAVDKYTVRVTLKEPDASWKYVPAMFYSTVFQKKFAEDHTEDFGDPGTLVMATGPWKFDSLNPTSGAELSAHEDYWGGKPSIEKISVKSFNDENSMALAMRAGEIDITPTVSGPKGFDGAAGGGTVTTVPTCATALMSIPTQTEPWDDVHVRRAVAYAINRDDIVTATQERAGGPLEYLISPILLRSLGSEEEVDAALESVPTYPHDLEKAKEELAKSKYPDGFSETMTVSSAVPMVQVIVDQLKEIDIDLKLETMTATAWVSKITGPADERPLTYTESGTCTPDPSWDEIYLGSEGLAEGRLNLANWAPDDVDQLLKDGLTTQEPEKRLEIYTSVLQRLGEDVPYVPLYAEGATYASTEYDIVDFGSYWMNSPWALNVKAK